MRRAALLVAAALPLALAACPLPQPLAEVARTADGGAVSTPIILPETALPAETTVLVSPDCIPAPQFVLSATVEDLDTDESVDARWFVDWQPDKPGLLEDDPVPASGDPSDPEYQKSDLQPDVFVAKSAEMQPLLREVRSLLQR